MIYPNYLKKDDTIGICALSAGVGDDIEQYEKSLSFLSKRYFDTYNLIKCSKVA